MTTIDFACRQFKLNEIIKCSLGLSKADLRVFSLIIENPEKEYTAEEIAKQLNMNLSTAQRAVKKLHEKEILIRYQKNLKPGGYVFYYKSRPKKAISKKIMQIIKKWLEAVEKKFCSWC